MNPATAGFTLRTGSAGSKGSLRAAIHAEIPQCSIEVQRQFAPTQMEAAAFLPTKLPQR